MYHNQKPPGPDIQGVSFTQALGMDGRIELTWTAPSPAGAVKEYNVYVKQTATAITSVVGETPVQVVAST